MSRKVSRREFVRSDMATGAALAASPVVITQKTVKLVVISDTSGIRFKNKGPMSGIETRRNRVWASVGFPTRTPTD